MPDCTKNYNFIYLVKQLASSKLWTFSADAFVAHLNISLSYMKCIGAKNHL